MAADSGISSYVRAAKAELVGAMIVILEAVDSVSVRFAETTKSNSVLGSGCDCNTLAKLLCAVQKAASQSICTKMLVRILVVVDQIGLLSYRSLVRFRIILRASGSTPTSINIKAI